jgi:hypothetical protein
VTINTHGNPPWTSAQGGGAYIAADQNQNSTSIDSTNLNTSSTNDKFTNTQYQRQSVQHAQQWTYNQTNTRNKTQQDTKKDSHYQEPRDIDKTVHFIEEEAERQLYDRWHVPRLGNMAENRPDGIFRFMGAQLNSISSADSRDRKVTEIDRIMETWEVQGGCFQEIGINWSMTSYNRNMTSWFRLKNQEIRTHTAHNIHENFKASQQGGVGQFMCKDLISFTKETESDFRGLGRWCSWTLFASPNHKTRIVCAYNLGKRKSNHLGTIYQQHLRYIQLNNMDTMPYELFCTDFTTSTKQWQTAGERLLLFVDMNEHVLQGHLAKQLLALNLSEATHTSWGEQEPNTHISGSKPIDGVYHSGNLEVTSTLLLSFHEGVGDHRTVLIDVTARSLLGTDGH